MGLFIGSPGAITCNPVLTIRTQYCAREMLNFSAIGLEQQWQWEGEVAAQLDQRESESMITSHKAASRRFFAGTLDEDNFAGRERGNIPEGRTAGSVIAHDAELTCRRTTRS